MWSLTKRNLYLFFSSPSTIFFSLLGALIAFVLYTVFLRDNIDSALMLKNYNLLLDPWVIGGILTVTTITTTLTAFSQMIIDRGTKTLADFLITPVAYFKIQFSYIISAITISIAMQFGMLAIMYTYFSITDQLRFPFEQLVPLFLLIILSSLVWTAFSQFILSFVTRIETLGRLGTIIGTMSGFLAGVYLPSGMLPDSAQRFINLTPAIYNAALFRNLLMKKPLSQTFNSVQARHIFEKSMGVRININGPLTGSTMVIILFASFLGFSLLSLLLSKRSRNFITKQI